MAAGGGQTSRLSTSDFFCSTFLCNASLNNKLYTTDRRDLKVLIALHSSVSSVFVRPGWKDLLRFLPILGEGDEWLFLLEMLTELDEKFAIQLAGSYSHHGQDQSARH